MVKGQSPGLAPVAASAASSAPQTKLLIEKRTVAGIRPGRNEPQIEARQGSASRRQARFLAGRRAARHGLNNLFGSF